MPPIRPSSQAHLGFWQRVDGRALDRQRLLPVPLIRGEVRSRWRFPRRCVPGGRRVHGGAPVPDPGQTGDELPQLVPGLRQGALDRHPHLRIAQVQVARHSRGTAGITFEDDQLRHGGEGQGRLLFGARFREEPQSVSQVSGRALETARRDESWLRPVEFRPPPDRGHLFKHSGYAVQIRGQEAGGRASRCSLVMVLAHRHPSASPACGRPTRPGLQVWRAPACRPGGPRLAGLGLQACGPRLASLAFFLLHLST